MTKLSFSQIDDAKQLDDLENECGCEVDESCYRTTYQRKELRTNRQREAGELVGTGDIRKHRKY